MKKVKIEKFISGKQEESFSFPAFFLGLANILLPQLALNALRDKGIDISGMLLAKKLGTQYTATLNVVEKGIAKTVVVSVI